MNRPEGAWTTAAAAVLVAAVACVPSSGSGSGAGVPPPPDVQVTPEAPPAPEELPVMQDVDPLTAVLSAATSYLAERATRDTLYLSPAWRVVDRISTSYARGPLPTRPG